MAELMDWMQACCQPSLWFFSSLEWPFNHNKDNIGMHTVSILDIKIIHIFICRGINNVFLQVFDRAHIANNCEYTILTFL